MLLSLFLSLPAAAKEVEPEAKQLYAKAIAAQQAGDLKAARDSFRAAWKVQRHYKIAANLGSVENELGEYRQAAVHLDEAIALYKRDAKQDGGVDKSKLDALQQIRKEATRHVASFSALASFDGQVVPDGELLVDGESLGKLELGRVYYLLPGERTVSVRATGVASSPQVVMAAENVAGQFDIALWADGPGRQPARGAEEPTSLGLALGITAAAVAVPAVIGGVGVALANGASDDVANYEAALASGAPSGASPFSTCAVSTPDCDAWRRARASRTNYSAMAAGGFAAAGGAAIAGAIYALWPSSSTTRAAVVLGPQQATWTVQGSF